MNLGRLALSQKDFVATDAHLEKAASLRPSDPAILTALAHAQNGNHQYREAIGTVARIHELQHPGMGNAHYVAAVAAVALNDLLLAQEQLNLFLQEDPSNPLAATARYNLDVFKRNQKANAVRALAAQQLPQLVAAKPSESLANSDRLKAQLADTANEDGGGSCENSSAPLTLAAKILRRPRFLT